MIVAKTASRRESGSGRFDFPDLLTCIEVVLEVSRRLMFAVGLSIAKGRDFPQIIEFKEPCGTRPELVANSRRRRKQAKLLHHRTL